MDWRLRFTRWPLPYDYTDAKSIEAYGKRLLEKTLREHVPEDLAFSRKGKGGWGVLLEKCYFFKIPDNRPEPDFPEAGVELKSSPIKRIEGSVFVPKERLVLGMIDYDNLRLEEWKTSSFMKKNSRLLLVLYLYERNRETLDYVVKAVTLWRFPEEDLEIIRRDWEYIFGKISRDQADELSEGDTLYLGACTKAADSSVRRTLKSGQLVKPRAFALKQGYMRTILHKHILKVKTDSEPFLKTKSLKAKAASIEDLVTTRFQPFIGMTAVQIARKLGVNLKPKAKGFHAAITRAVLGIRAGSIEEFEKAEIISRTIRVRADGKPLEHVSFPAFRPLELVKQRWEDSDLRQLLIRRFFFVIFRVKEKGAKPVLDQTAFWTMPTRDRELPIRAVWDDAVEALRSGHPERLPKIKESFFAHVRPHGSDSNDTVEAPMGRVIVKQCFWLNAGYVQRELGLSGTAKKVASRKKRP